MIAFISGIWHSRCQTVLTVVVPVPCIFLHCNLAAAKALHFQSLPVLYYHQLQYIWAYQMVPVFFTLMVHPVALFQHMPEIYRVWWMYRIMLHIRLYCMNGCFFSSCMPLPYPITLSPEGCSQRPFEFLASNYLTCMCVCVNSCWWVGVSSGWVGKSDTVCIYSIYLQSVLCPVYTFMYVCYTVSHTELLSTAGIVEWAFQGRVHVCIEL